MRIFKLLVGTTLMMVTAFCATAQKEGLDKEAWIKANLYYKQDAIDFIKMTYKSFTPVIGKRTTETGIYRQTVTFRECELIIETDTRSQASAWKSDHEFGKHIVVIDLDKVTIDGNDIKPSSAENANGLFAGSSFEYSKKIPSYSILTPVINKDDERFVKLHYEQHLQWAYEFLIAECSKH